MRARVRPDKLPLLLLLGVLLGLFILSPLVSVFAELDEPPGIAEPAGNRGSVQALQGDESTLQGRRMGGLDSGEAAREAEMMDNLRRGVLVVVSWIFLVVGLTLVALTLRKTYIWLRAVQKARVPPTRYFNLLLQVRNRDGELGLYNFDYYPVVVAASGSPDLLLPDVEDSRSRFRIDYHQGHAHLLSDSSIIVNGVPRQNKPLKQDDRIIFGPYRLIFKDASIQEHGPPVPGKPVFVWQFPIVALLLALSVLFKQAGAVPEDKMLLAKAAELQSFDTQSTGLKSTVQQTNRPGSVEVESAELDSAETGGADIAAAERSGSVAKSTRQGGEQPESPERITLSQRLRWLFSRRVKEEVRLVAAEVRESPVPPVAEVAVVKAASRQPATPMQTTTERKPQEQRPQEHELWEQNAGEQKIETRKPEEQGSARVAIAEVKSPAKREIQAPRAVPETAEVDARPAPGKEETRSTPDDIEDSHPSRQKIAAAQPLPHREPVPSSEPPVETTAEVPQPRTVASTAVAEVSTESRRGVTEKTPVLQASVLAAVSPPGVQNNVINPLEALSFARARSAPEIGRVKVRVIPPGRKPEYFKADILFIHAHPDDESIDFGSLMAMASRSNKRIVTLLLTDGESGLDLYPERKVGDIYPARDLKGGALSQVRVVEAARALSILGSEMYIRWGLENRPYNSKADEVPPDEVIRGWGGEEQLVERLIEVLEGFRPTIVVSPDRHSKAYEHFEHEAVGQLVQSALERLRRDSGVSFVKGHIVSIDPHQVDRYSGVTNVDAKATDGQSGLAYRAIQALALKEHVTQRDAAVIAVSRLSHLPEEYYKALYWDLNLSLEEYLK